MKPRDHHTFAPCVVVVTPQMFVLSWHNFIIICWHINSTGVRTGTLAASNVILTPLFSIYKCINIG